MSQITSNAKVPPQSVVSIKFASNISSGNDWRRHLL